MSKEKKIEVYNTTKMVLKLILGPIVIFGIMGIMQAILSIPDAMAFTLMSIIIVSYCICVIFNKKNKMQISIEEFLQMNSNVEQSRLKEKLYKHGFTENEIKKIMKDRPVSSYIARQQQTLANTNEVDVSSSLEDLKEGFAISNKLLTKAGLGIVIDSKSEEIAIIQQNKEIQYVQFNQIHSYDVSLAEAGSGNGAMALASITGNDSLYRLGMANTVAGNKNIFSYVIKLVLNDVDTADIDVNILHKKMLNSSVEFMEIDKVGKSITTFLDKIITKKFESTSKSNLSEIKELKELLDMGAITQEEFNEKKKELLK